jgi:sulfate permease, SulP family
VNTTATTVDEPRPGLLQRYLPIFAWLPKYDRTWLKGDAVAGLSVWALLVPQSLAYATLTGVPVQYGLYTAFAALLAYPIFGTSKHLAEGPSAAICALCAAVITPLVGAGALGTDAASPFAAALALATAAVYIVLGLLRMGWVSTFLSKAVMAGFILGFSIGIIIDQSHKLLGVPGPSGSYMEELWGTVKEIPDTGGTTLAVGAGSLALLLLMRYLLPKWPRTLIVTALAILAVSLFDLGDHGVAITGDVPTGLFSIGLPGIGWSDTDALLLGALSVVFVGYSESLAAARAMAAKHHYEIDTNQELIAQGTSCGAAGLVGGFPVAGSLSKTSVADSAGQRTEMASLINAVFILLTLLFLASIFENLPSATLGAVVIDAMVGLVTFSQLRRYYRVDRRDWVFFTGAMAGILFFGILQGVLIGVVLSLLLLIARSSRTSVRPLGRDPKSDTYHYIERHDGLETTPGVLVVRIDGPLFFADADRFRTHLQEYVRQEGALAGVVIDAGAVHLSDTDGADILIQVAGELKSRGTSLVLAYVHPPVLELWRRAGVLNAVGDDGVFLTIHNAVERFANRGTLPGDQPSEPRLRRPTRLPRHSGD